jgi:hypothetical protein
MSAGRETKDLHAINVNGKQYSRGRLVWAWHHAAWPLHSICHLNHDRYDDRIENLADLPDVERRHNTVEQQRALPVGVRQYGQRYHATCNHQHVGTFSTPEQAHEAYKQAHINAFGMLSAHAKATGVDIC